MFGEHGNNERDSEGEGQPRVVRVIDLPFRVFYTTKDNTRNPNRCERVYIEVDRETKLENALGSIAHGISAGVHPSELRYAKEKIWPSAVLKKGTRVDVTQDILAVHGRDMLVGVAHYATFQAQKHSLLGSALEKVRHYL